MEQTASENKSILIIKSHPQGLGPAEGFLRNRQWKIKSTTNLKEALIYLVQNQPQFVMISIDHPNRKVRNLPKVLAQAFPVCVIAFAETTSAANIKILTETRAEYAIFPPVTGPSIERTVNKYYKDLQHKGLTSNSRAGSWEESTANVRGAMISIKGGSAPSENSAQSLLAQLLAGDGDSAALQGAHIPAEGAAIAISPQGLPSEAATALSSSGGFAPGMNGGPGHEGSGLSSQPSSLDEEPRPISYDPRPPKNDGPGWAPLAPKQKNSQRPGASTDDDGNSVPTQDSLISKGARDALERSCERTDSEDSADLMTATNVACIFVESMRFSGYLVAAMAKDKKVDMAFIEKIRQRLFHFLRSNGESVEDNESMSMKVREVPFEDWALAHADFLRKSVHNGEEVAMAFFPRDNVKAQVMECSDEEMAAVSIHELASDIPVEFNVYIYLPRNNKYVLYTPHGSTFFNNQKERLVNQGVTHLHVLKVELTGLDKYRAQNFLNDKINEFTAKERAKETV